MAATQTDRTASTTAFRADIQALRAIAVTVVVLYHLWPNRIPGGFIGVDVFFVISGFLITQHLLKEVQLTGRIALTRFWARRIRRLLPAAYLVLAASLIILLAFMPPVTWQLNLAEIRASAAYVENWYLGFNAIDYLASENNASVAQHYWSLAVEEQFYLLWPILIVMAMALCRRFSRPAQRIRWIVGVLGLVFIASFGLSVVATPMMPEIAFFATPLRAWEFAVGGLIAISSLRAKGAGDKVRAVASWAGWSIIAAGSFFIVGSRVQFPGWIAVIPVTGAALSLWAGDAAPRWSPKALLRNRFVQWIGEYSYAIYLWHWPLVIAAPWILGGPAHWPSKLAIAAATCVMAFLTKRWIEDPVRTGEWWRSKQRRSYSFAVVGTVVLVAISSVWNTQLDREWVEKDSQSVSLLNAGEPCYAAAAMVNKCSEAFHRPSDMDIAFAAADFDPELSACQQPADGVEPVFCYYGVEESQAQLTIAVVGNSHALRLVPALERYGLQHHWRIILAAKTDCLGPVVSGLGSATAQCQGWSRNVQQGLLERGDVDAVIFGSHVGAKFYLGGPDPSPEDMAKVEAGVIESFRAFREQGIEVIVSGDVPGTRPFDAPSCVASSNSTEDPCSRPRVGNDLSNTLVDIALAHPDLVDYFSMADFMCDSTTCHAVVGGVVVYSDSHHLTTAFSRSLAPYLGDEIEALVAGRGRPQ